MSGARSDPPRYVMIGGFLGAGKTTALDRLARTLDGRGVRVGLITNDQSSGLVDTTLLRSHGWSVEEIAGGCFCCRFDSLQQAADRLTQATRPDVFLAEPVGSCTDLVATVSYPLRRIYGDRFRIAPLSVLVDPMRAARVLSLVEGRAFSSNVAYVYEKQLEEADLIVVNKIDDLADDLRHRLVAFLAERFPRAEVLCASAKRGDGLDAWFDRILDAETDEHATIDLDYARYADGEAELGWLNTTLEVTADAPLDGNDLLLRLTGEMQRRVGAGGGEIAHLKMTLDSPDAGGQLSAVSVARGDAEPDLRESLLDLVSGGTLIVNLRADLAPELLSRIVRDVIGGASRGGTSVRLAVAHEEHFRPAPPVPVHRLEVTADGARASESETS